MRTWKILLTDGLGKEGKEVLSSKAEIGDRKGITADELLSEIEDYQAVIVRGRTKITRQVLEQAKNLKVVGRAGVGVDNIDLKAAQENNVTVVNAPVATTTSVAELTMGFIFSLAREIPRADGYMKKGEWIKKQLVGVELKNKILGIIGYGLLALAALAKFFDKTGDRGIDRFLLLASVGGMGFALYLTAIEAFVLHAWCLYCVGQQIAIALILILVLVLFFKKQRDIIES